MSQMPNVYIGIGSNQQQPGQQVRQAIATLTQHPALNLMTCSSLYRSAPVGVTDQPDFINAVCGVNTELSPSELLQLLQGIEKNAGRVRNGVRWGPRTLDLDILLYGDRLLETSTLTIPHPRMHERAFVLYPLLEIAPDLEIPGYGSVADLAEKISEQHCVRIDSVGV